MSKNILILSGSPRKDGNTDLLCQEFQKGAQSAGHEASVVHLADLELAACKACDYCRKKGGACVIKDGMSGLLDQVIKADAIVLASPVYFYSLTATMKAFIDRSYARYDQIKGKDFYLAALAADTNTQALDLTLETMKVYASFLGNSRIRGTIKAEGVWNKGAVEGHPALKTAYRMGEQV